MKATRKIGKSNEPALLLLEQCHHETTKPPQDEPCKFCGKRFPTWDKLTAHLARHIDRGARLDETCLEVAQDMIEGTGFLIKNVDLAERFLLTVSEDNLSEDIRSE